MLIRTEKFNKELLLMIKKYSDSDLMTTRAFNMICRSMYRENIPMDNIYNLLDLDWHNVNNHNTKWRTSIKTKSRKILISIQDELKLMSNNGAGI